MAISSPPVCESHRPRAAPGIRAAARSASAEAAEQSRGEAELMRAWGVGPGEPERMPFDLRAQLAERLRSGRLGRFADLIGRFRRDFVGILFSSSDSVRVCRFPGSQPAGITEVLDFAEHFFGGGTEFRTPLAAAVKLLEEEFNSEGRRRGDIVMITEGECDVSEQWMRSWNDAKHTLGFRSFGVGIGAPQASGPGSVLDALCDSLRGIEDLTDVHAAGDLFRLI
jgi:hypothetical protein